MRRAALALTFLLAGCSAQSTAYVVRSGPTPTSTTTSSTTTSSTSSTTSTTVVPTTRTTTAPVAPVSPPLAGTTTASWYGDESGPRTADGAAYDPSGLTFANREMKFGTAVRFCGPLGCVVARCTDRGPATWTGRDFDLSEGSFAQVATLSKGVERLTWEVVQ